MQRDFELFPMPMRAAENAEHVDALYAYLVANATFFTFLIALLILFFAIRYRRGARVNRRQAPTFHLGLELTWSAIPLVVTLVSFTWGAKLFFDGYHPPADAQEIYVTGKQWMWRIQHPEGRREINELHVPLGQAVKLTMISEDVIHSFFIPVFRKKQDVLPGRYTSLWFRATRPGRYHLFCAEYCGASHSRMRGAVIVQPPDEHARWLAELPVEPAEAVGWRLFERYRCSDCHKREPTVRGPSLHGLFGSQVTLATGERVRADLAYLRRSIVEPAAQVTAGYSAVMPSYEGQISEEEILLIAAYLRRPDEAERKPTEEAAHDE